jgi:predicted nicotinamide N-methyase
MPTAALPAELAALESRFEIAYTDVALAGGIARLAHPRSAEDLISELDFDRDERLPYWADLWPSAIALARVLPALAPTPGRALELGCGLGLVTIAALRTGHAVLSTDYYADALLFTRRNARSAAGREPDTRLVDWRAWPADMGRFDLIVASDVLYERPYAAQVAVAIATSLAPQGRALIADPGRAAFGTFVAECTSIGLAIAQRMRIPHHDGALHQVITIHEVAAAT